MLWYGLSAEIGKTLAGELVGEAFMGETFIGEFVPFAGETFMGESAGDLSAALPLVPSLEKEAERQKNIDIFTNAIY